MKNLQIANIFYEMADILEMKGILWKPRAYRQAARAIEGMPQAIENIYKDGGLERLEEIPGVGEGIGKKIEEFLKTGKVKEHEQLKKSIPSHINVLMHIPSLGPKKVKKLNQVLKIKTINDLKRAAKTGKIRTIEGFGEKSEQDILEGIGISKTLKGRIPYSEAKAIADKIIRQLKKLKEVKDIIAAGSLRRKKPTIGDIDLLVSSNNPQKVIDAFTTLKDIQKVLAKGPTKAMVILKSGTQTDLRVIKPISWGAGLFYFTGSKNYDIEMRKVAIKLGYKLNEYGLYDKNNDLIASKTEADICKKLGVKLLKPEERG